MNAQEFKDIIREGLRYNDRLEGEAAVALGMKKEQISRFFNQPSTGMRLDRLVKLIDMAGLTIAIAPRD